LHQNFLTVAAVGAVRRQNLPARVIDLFPYSAYVSASSNQPIRGARVPISAAESISPAFQRTKQQLFHPFRFGQWARLAFVGLLAGEMGSGGCNLSSPFPNHQSGSPASLGTILPPPLMNHPAMLAALIASVVVLGLVLGALFIYINSVMRFVLFDSVVAGECHVRKGWVRRRRHGRRLFWWQLLFGLVAFATIVIVVGVPVAIAWALGLFHDPSQHILPLVLGGILLFFVFLVLIVVLATIQVMTNDFVVPQMALEEIGAMEGWRRLWALLKAEKGGYAGYIGMKIILTIAASIVFGIITIVVLLVLLVPVGGAGVVAVLAGKAAGLTWNAFTITLVVIAACLVIAILVFLAALISVPAIVFFPAYSIYFFAARYAPLSNLLWPQPPAPA
jgi:hypothetical protein